LGENTEQSGNGFGEAIIGYPAGVGGNGRDLSMLAIAAAVIFGIAIIMDLAEASIGIASGTVVTIGLLCLALHMAGVGTAARTGNGRRWRARR
jgi:hypothetical protein